MIRVSNKFFKNSRGCLVEWSSGGNNTKYKIYKRDKWKYACEEGEMLGRYDAIKCEN